MLSVSIINTDTWFRNGRLNPYIDHLSFHTVALKNQVLGISTSFNCCKLPEGNLLHTNAPHALQRIEKALQFISHSFFLKFLRQRLNGSIHKKLQTFLSVRTAPPPCFWTNNMCTFNCGCHCAQAMTIPVTVFHCASTSCSYRCIFQSWKTNTLHHLSALNNQICVSLDGAILDYLILKLIVWTRYSCTCMWA